MATVESPRAVRPAATVGSLNPLHSTAMGKLLAFADPGLIDSTDLRDTVTRLADAYERPHAAGVGLPLDPRRARSRGMQNIARE